MTPRGAHRAISPRRGFPTGSGPRAVSGCRPRPRRRVARVPEALAGFPTQPSIGCAVLRSAVRCCALLRSAVRCCALLRGAAQCCALLRSAARCYAVLRGAARCCATRSDRVGRLVSAWRIAVLPNTGATEHWGGALREVPRMCGRLLAPNGTGLSLAGSIQDDASVACDRGNANWTRSSGRSRVDMMSTCDVDRLVSVAPAGARPLRAHRDAIGLSVNFLSLGRGPNAATRPASEVPCEPS